MADITKGYIVKKPINNRKDVKTFYTKNSEKVQKKRAQTRLKKGFTVRDSTLNKYGLDRPVEEEEELEPEGEELDPDQYKKITLEQIKEIMIKYEGKNANTYFSRFKTFFIKANGCDPKDLNHCFDKSPQEMVDNFIKYGKKNKFAYGKPGGKYNDYLSPVLNILQKVDYFIKKYPEHLKIYKTLLHKNKDEHSDAAIIKAKTEPLKFTYQDWRDATLEMPSRKHVDMQDKALMLVYLEHTLRDDFGKLHLVKSMNDQTKDKNYFDMSTNTIYVYDPKKASKKSKEAWKNTLNKGFKMENEELIKLATKLTKIKGRKFLFEYDTPNLSKSIKQIVKGLGLTDNFSMKSDFRRARTTYEHKFNKFTNSQKRDLAHSMLHDQSIAEKLYFHPEE